MKYQLKKIVNFQMTRDMMLENINTGTIDVAFDDDLELYEYMKVGVTYDCKILLFGDIVDEATERSLKCKVLQTGLVIGKLQCLEIAIEEDIYYFSMGEYKDLVITANEDIYIRYSRKDLVEVNNMVTWKYRV